MNKMPVMSAKKSSEIFLRKLRSVDELKELLVDYAPNKQAYLCRDKQLCYFGTSPTLAELNRDYDEQAALSWLVPQLTNIVEFSNCKSIFGEGQLRSCAEMIVTEYYYMKITELMLFFYKFKNGEYGQFYGTASPMVIMCSLRQFKRDRNDVIFEHESQEREQRQQEAKKGAITMEEYYAPKVKAITEYFDAIINIITTLAYKFNNKKV